MMKLRILNMKNFLAAVNDCEGPVNLVHPDGWRENINKQYYVQKLLTEEYIENGNYLKLRLEIPESGDYMRFVSRYVAEC